MAKWKLGRERIGDDEFFASLGQISWKRDEVAKVRAEVANATRLPAELISPDDTISELEAFGDLSHSSILDYFVDILFVKEPTNEPDLRTVRDFVAEFGPNLTMCCI